MTLQNLEADNSSSATPDFSTVNVIAESMSWASCLSVMVPILTYICFPIKRKFPNRLPLYMCLSCLGLSVTQLVGIYLYATDAFCFYQALGTQFFACQMVSWWLIISFNFYYVVCKGRIGDDVKFERMFHIFTCSYSTLLTAIAASLGSFDTAHDGRWECWISRHSIDLQLSLFYGEMGVACFIGLFFWPASFYRIWQLHKDGKRMMGYARHMLFIVSFFFYFCVMLVYRILVHQGSITSSVDTMHTLCVCGTGLTCFLVFGVSKSNLQLWLWKTGCSQPHPYEASVTQTELDPCTVFVASSRRPSACYSALADGPEGSPSLLASTPTGRSPMRLTPPGRVSSLKKQQQQRALMKNSAKSQTQATAAATAASKRGGHDLVPVPLGVAPLAPPSPEVGPQLGPAGTGTSKRPRSNKRRGAGQPDDPAGGLSSDEDNLLHE